MIRDTLEDKFYPCLMDEKVFSIHNAVEEIMNTCFKVEETRDDDDDVDSVVSHNSIKTVQTRNTKDSDQALQKLHHLVLHSSSNAGATSGNDESLRHLQCLTNQTAQRIQRDFERDNDKSEFYHIRYLHEKYGRRPDALKYCDVNRARPLAF